MRIFAYRILLAPAALLWAGSALGQAAPVAEAQLQSGFLRDRNIELSNQDAPNEEAYTRRAAEAIGAGDFTGGLAILRRYRMSATLNDWMLSGQAHVGLGDYDAARKDFGTAIKKRKNFSPAQIALAELEAGHGDKAVATELLTALTARRDACGGRCAEQRVLDAGTGRIEAALKARP
ncbi:tetratricopeptide repeat protein [Novosphingobium sp.]|uniref:tetratricopeptide repeat protein n=1 Tax=Novosphingobium sp. TaxID=1874826 RepID=UPI0038BBFD1A